jgi:hypothetical protein
LTQLVAPPALLRRFKAMRRTEGIHAFIKAAEKQVRIQQRLPARPVKTQAPAPPPPERMGDPTPERAIRAEAVMPTKVPPFNSQILGPVQRFAKQLGPETMMVLERLCEVGIQGGNSRGLTAGYDGIKVDSSRTGYQHLSDAESAAYEQFRVAMGNMPPELQLYAKELVLENIGEEINSARGAPPRRSRSVAEIGGEITGYTSDSRYTTGAVVATLKIIAWCVQRELGVKRRKP